MTRIGIAVALGAMAVFAPRRAVAQEPRTSSLSWVRLPGAEACVAAAPLAEAVEARLGRKVFVSAADADLNLEGSIGPRAEGTGFVATLRVTARDGSALGSREVESDGADCAAIDGELSLVVSLLIDPEAPPPVTPPPAPPVPAPAPPPAPVPPPPPKTIEKERVVYVTAPREPFRFAVSVGFLSTLGLQPDLGLGVAPALVLEVPGPIGVLAEGGITAATTIEAESGARADASYAHGGLAICPLVAHPAAWSALACAGWVLGVLSADGEGFDVDASGASIASGPWLEGRLELAIAGPLVVVTSLGLVMPIARAEIGYVTPAGPKALYQTSPIAGLADLGVGLRFP